jgi:hypothetical protein
MTQRTLFEPQVIPPVDPHVTPEEKPRLSRQSAEILERLRQGQATNRELAQIAMRYSARLHDLKHAGYSWKIVSRDYETGSVVYALERE